MRTIAIGDLHGKDCWKQVDFNLYQKVIFIGDYTDSYTLSTEVIYKSLLQLIALKKAHPEKVILLLGNHDIQYLFFPNFRCTGFRPEAQRDLTALFLLNKECFQVAFQQGNYLFTHAGVSNSWMNQYAELKEVFKREKNSMSDALNKVYHSENYYLLHDVGKVRGGIFKFGGILWADRSETNRDYLEGVHQVVGHTPMENIKTFGDSDSSITYIDVLNTRIEFYELTA